MVGQTIESRINQGIEVKICSILFLYSKEEQIPMVGSRLLEVKSSYYQEQNATTVKFTNSELSFFFIFIFHLHFLYFSIFRIARVRVRSDQPHCHISHNLMVWSQHWSQDLGE